MNLSCCTFFENDLQPPTSELVFLTHVHEWARKWALKIEGNKLLCEIYYSNFPIFSRFGRTLSEYWMPLHWGRCKLSAGVGVCVCVVTCARVDRDHSSTKARSVQHISALTNDGVYKNLHFNTATKLLSVTTLFFTLHVIRFICSLLHTANPQNRKISLFNRYFLH